MRTFLKISLLILFPGIAIAQAGERSYAKMQQQLIVPLVENGLYRTGNDHFSKGQATNGSETYELYLTRIAAAEAFLQLNKISTARAYLDACPAELRNKEWYFLDRLLDQSELSISRPGMPALTTLQLSPDQRMLAVGGADSTITLYRYPDLEKIRELKGHLGSVSTLDFSADGKRLVSGGRDHQVILWDIPSGDAVFVNDTSFTQGIYQVRFSPNGQQIGVVSWELRSFSPRVMGFAKLLDSTTGQTQQKIETEPHPAAGIVFTHGGKNIIVACWGEVVLSYELASGKLRWDYDLTGPEEYNSFHSIDLSPDGQHLALGSTDHRVHIINTQTGELIHRIEPWEGHTKTVKAVQYSEDGQWLATAGEDQTILVWSTSDYSRKHTLSGHTKTVSGLAWTADRSALLSVSVDGSLKRWNLAQPVVQSYKVCNYGPWQLPIHPDGRRFAAPCSDDRLAIYDGPSGQLQTLLAEQSGLCGEFSADGEWLVTASHDDTVRVWQVASGKEQKTFAGHGRSDGVTFLQNSMRVASVGDSTLRIWPLTGSAPPLVVAFDSRPFRVISGPDESQLFVGLRNGTVKVIDAAGGREVNSIDAARGLSEITISSNGQYLAIFDGPVIHIWDLAANTHRYTLQGHEQQGYGFDFSPDNRYLISGSYDQTFKLWNLDNGRCTLTFHAYEETIYTARFLAERELLIGSSKGRMWYYNFSE